MNEQRQHPPQGIHFLKGILHSHFQCLLENFQSLQKFNILIGIRNQLLFSRLQDNTFLRNGNIFPFSIVSSFHIELNSDFFTCRIFYFKCDELPQRILFPLSGNGNGLCFGRILIRFWKKKRESKPDNKECQSKAKESVGRLLWGSIRHVRREKQQWWNDFRNHIVLRQFG